MDVNWLKDKNPDTGKALNSRPAKRQKGTANLIGGDALDLGGLL